MNQRRIELLQEAVSLILASQDLEAAAEIAKRAGYTPGAIYSYFDSKEAIFSALADAGADIVIGDIRGDGLPDA